MANITLISSLHKTYGNCNPQELYKLIEQINPDLIFEELSNETFNIIYSPFFQPESVEALAIKEYLKKYPIKHFPVDNYHFSESDLLSDAQIIWNLSSEYRSLWNENLCKIHQNGYHFLNSDECVNISRRLKTIEEEVLAQSNSHELLIQFQREKDLHKIREYEMLREVYKYSELYQFENGLFICGSEHRQGLKDKISEIQGEFNIKISWSFFNEGV